MKLLLINLFWISTLYFSCKSDVNTSCNDGEGLYIKARYPIGAAINFDALVSDLRYLNIAANQFNSVSPENILKAENIHPEENRFNWTQVDSLISFCERYNKRFYGHTLIWHNQLPQWILDFKGNTMQWEHLMKTHIQTIISHYKDKVIAWEVVNEAFNEDGTLRNSIWFENIGPSYIEKAFKYAKEANPNALLFYNDYNLESNPIKLRSVINLLNGLRNKGLKVDGIGVQMHISTSYPEPSQIAGALKEIVSNQYQVHISELDISINPNNIDIQLNQKNLNDQANLYSNIVFIYNEIPKQYQFGITFWGVTDQYSWIRDYFKREDYPLLYDNEYQPKPAYCKLKTTL